MKIERYCGGPVFRGSRVKAKYTPSKNPMYRHNAFTEALPPAMETTEVMERIVRSPAYDKSERLLSDTDRLEAVQRIASFVDPMPIHLELYRRFSRLIRNGYMARNPIKAEWKKQIRAGFPKLVWGPGDDGYEPIIRSSAAGFGIIGISGVGKTTAVESTLGLFPQVIEHTEYKGHPLHHNQLVWLKVDCPKDGSIKGLCQDILRATDQLLGEDFQGTYRIRRLTVDELVPLISQAASVVGLGTLVIDEVQRLNEAKSGGADQMMNFFVYLINTIGVPVVLVGTPRTLNLIRRDFSYARRATGQGDLIWTNLPNDDNWDLFVEGLWRYQWTKKRTELTKELKVTLYEESQGLVDIAVKLYMLAQWSIIGIKDAQDAGEPITPGLIRSVAKESLRLVKPTLDALRSNDKARLETIRDIHIPYEDLDDFLNRAKERVTLEGKLNMVRNRQMAEAHAPGDSEDALVFRVARWLVEAGFAPDVAKTSAAKAINRNGAGVGLNGAMQEAFILASEATAISENTKDSNGNTVDAKKPPAKEKRQGVPLSGDLRKIVKDAHKKGVPGYEALKEAGVVKDATELLPA